MTDENFEYFLNEEGFAPAIKCRPVDEATLLRYTGKLPDRLIEYWKEYGFCGYGDGLLWTVNPSEYEEVLEMWLSSTPLWGRENYYVIARSAFGVMYVLGEDSVDDTVINPHYSNIVPGNAPDKNLSAEQKDRKLSLFFGVKGKKSLDMNDQNDKPLFKKIVKKIGSLDYDEMYAFVPALAAGGIADIEHVQIVKIHEQLELLAELDTPLILKSVGELFEKQ